MLLSFVIGLGIGLAIGLVAANCADHETLDAAARERDVAKRAAIKSEEAGKRWIGYHNHVREELLKLRQAVSQAVLQLAEAAQLPEGKDDAADAVAEGYRDHKCCGGPGREPVEPDEGKDKPYTGPCTVA